MSSSGGNNSWAEVDSRWCYIEGRERPYDCVRISVMVMLGIVTGAFCLARVIQYHCYKAKNYHQYLVYYIAALICLISIIHWSYVVSAVLDLVITYFIVVQMLIICWFFYSWAFRILQQEKVFNYVILPVLCGVLFYYTACLIWASVRVSDVTNECAAPQWLLFTASQLLHVQLFLLSVIYITKRLNDIRTMRTNRFSQRAQLWGLAVMYELVSVAVFAYDVYFLVTKSVDHRCGTEFSAHPVGGTIMYIAHKVIKYFVPLWTICVVFAPLKARPPSVHAELEETDTLSWANRPNYQSTFYDTSVKKSSETESVVPFSLNSNHNTTPILPRTLSSSSSYPNSPWLVPGRSWGSGVTNKLPSPSVPVRSNQPQGHS